MHPATIPMALALFAVGSVAAQPGLPTASPAYGVGSAHAMLMSARPCFAPADEAKLMDLLRISLARISETPDYREHYDRGMRMTQLQQRDIPRSDPFACNQIRDALTYFVGMHQGR